LKIKSVLIVVVASGTALLLFACGAAVVKQVGVQQIRDNAIGMWICDMSGTGANGPFKKVATVDIAESTFSLSVAQIEPAAQGRGDSSGTGTWSYDGGTLSMQYLSERESSYKTASNEPVFHWFGITDPLDAVEIEWILGYRGNENSASSTSSAMSVKIISATHISASGPYFGFYGVDNVAYDCIKSTREPGA